MGRASVVVACAVLTDVLGDHAERRVYHRVTGGGLPPDARIVGVSWLPGQDGVTFALESAAWPDDDSALPPIELAAYVMQGEPGAAE